MCSEDFAGSPSKTPLFTQDDAAAPVAASDVEEEPFLDVDVYDDCDIPFDVASGGLARAGDAEKSDAEAEEEAPIAPVALGRSQRKKMGTMRYQAALWEEH
ncbi:hypothetical protein B0H10DRAFT_2213202 [Mycena sp. CBHHK59/15]|nr:hypothetical protein B0H10DRAFT_2213202 [Mycena sp. CBHHK59/15]